MRWLDQTDEVAVVPATSLAERKQTSKRIYKKDYSTGKHILKCHILWLSSLPARLTLKAVYHG